MSIRRFLAVLFLIVASLGLQSCGDDEESRTAEPEREPAAVPEAPPEETEEPGGSFSPSVSYEVDAKAEDGVSESLRVFFGQVVPAREYQAPAGWPELQCPVDAQRDAVLPGVIEATNTTPGFAADLPASMEHIYGVAQGTVMARIKLSYSATGVGCNAQTGNAGSKPLINLAFRDIQPGQTGRQPFHIVIANYYSPRFPDGDREAISRVVLSPDLYTTESGDLEVTRLVGPGVHQPPANRGDWQAVGPDANVFFGFTLDGGSALAAMRKVGREA